MGYLLPIQYFQYQDYQNRIKPVKNSDIQTARINRLRRVYSSHNKNLSMRATLISSKEKEKNTDKVYADLTGIGKHFDEKI